jgi:hypothetical protein
MSRRLSCASAHGCRLHRPLRRFAFARRTAEPEERNNRKNLIFDGSPAPGFPLAGVEEKYSTRSLLKRTGDTASNAAPPIAHSPARQFRVGNRDPKKQFNIGVLVAEREITMKFQKTSLFVAIALAMSAGANLAYPQEFVQVPGLLSKIAVGGQSVWGINRSNQVYQYDPATRLFVQMEGDLVSIAVGGGTVRQPDEVWGIGPSRQIYRFNPSDLPHGLFEQIPGQLTQISVGPGYKPCHQAEVWGLNASGAIYRFDYCANSFFQVPGILAQITVGDGEVWGLNAAGQIYQFNIQTETWGQVPGILAGIETGGGQVWGLNSSLRIFRLDRNSGTFTQVPGILAHISVGGNGVWGLNFSGSIYRFDESSQGFVQMTGVLSTVASGTGGVWGLNAANDIYVFEGPF